MNILVTGATGFIGKYLVCHLFKHNPDLEKVIILTRNPKKAYKTFKKFEDRIYAVNRLKAISAVEKISTIIHLAGEPIADKKWSSSQKEKLKNSRISIIKDISDLIEKVKTKPELVITASAVGFYGSNLKKDRMDEDDHQINEDFTHELCQEIEEESLKIQNSKTRVCVARFGIVLGEKGGALKKMLPAFKLGLGGKIASGNQYMSWIHIHDLIYAIRFLMDNKDHSGIFNFTAPNAVSNQEFTKTLGKTLKRPTPFNMPEMMLTFLFGEMGIMLLARGQNIYPKKLLEAGFKFKYPKLERALKSVLGK